jgi:hypothetical protein
MSFIKYTHQEIRAIIASIEEIDEKDRNEQEDSVLEKSYEILKLQKQAKVKVTPELIINDDSSLTIVMADQISEKVGYKGVARLGNYFAVTEYWTGTFPTNQILKFFPIKRYERDEPETVTTANTRR